MQCAATTKSGNQCKNPVAGGSTFCRTHANTNDHAHGDADDRPIEDAGSPSTQASIRRYSRSLFGIGFGTALVLAAASLVASIMYLFTFMSAANAAIDTFVQDFERLQVQEANDETLVRQADVSPAPDASAPAPDAESPSASTANPAAAPEDDHTNESRTATYISVSDKGVGTTSGRLEQKGDRDTFVVYLESKGLTKIVLRATSDGFIPHLRVYDSNGDLVSWAAAGPRSALLDQEFEPGRYCIQAGSFEDRDIGDYTIRIDTAPAPPFPRPPRLLLRKEHQTGSLTLSCSWRITRKVKSQLKLDHLLMR